MRAVLPEEPGPCSECGGDMACVRVEIGGVVLCPTCLLHASETMAATISGALIVATDESVLVMRLPPRLRLLPGGRS
jgi:hypothetical protein